MLTQGVLASWGLLNQPWQLQSWGGGVWALGAPSTWCGLGQAAVFLFTKAGRSGWALLGHGCGLCTFQSALAWEVARTACRNEVIEVTSC